MSQNELGRVYAFSLTGGRMRRSAEMMRRRGQTLDALALVRRAAEQDDTPAAWLALAAELHQTGNWEAAVQILSRVLSRQPHQPGAWCEMARCLHALGQTPLAVDCAYHQLQEDPWSAEADAARHLLAEADAFPLRKEPARTQRMIQRGIALWQSGNRAAGERCIRRAVRIAADKKRLLVTAGMMCMLEMDLRGAMGYLSRALRCDPEDPRTLMALSTLLHQQGKRRVARGLLQRAGRRADSVMAEDGFLSAAWAQDAWPEMDAYITRRRKQYPHRTALLNARAAMYCESGRVSTARQIWREVLAIDPDDRQAATLNAWAHVKPEGFMCAAGLLPREERQHQLEELRQAAEEMNTCDLLRAGSRTRRLLDWALESSVPAERDQAMRYLAEAESDAMIAYLKELLCRPFLRMEVRQWALVRLAQLGCREEMMMMAGPHYTLVQCQPVTEEKPQRPWRRFCRVLLRESGRYRLGREMIGLAADIWPMLTPEQRMDAAHAGGATWARALEILCLRMAGEEEQAACEAARAAVSTRKISRVLRQIGRLIAMNAVTE